jgi:hypothetical protein
LPSASAFTVLGALLSSAVLLLGVHEPWLPLYGIVIAAPLQSVGNAIGLNAAR